MKKIGKEVDFIDINEHCPRIGEGSFIRLKNGELLYILTEYIGSERDDHCEAQLSASISSDRGESWSTPVPILKKDEDAANIMSTSLIRLSNGGLGMVYLQKNVKDDGFICMPYFIFSDDEGKSWSRPIICSHTEGYYCVINDGVIVLKSGRILVPMAYCGDTHIPGKGFSPYRAASVRFAYSDDCGASWHDHPTEILSPYDDSNGFAEPGVYEYENGELWMWCRTLYGFQYQSFSSDGGLSWTPPTPNFFFSSPDAPMRVKRVGDYTVAVFNPIPRNSSLNMKGTWWRSPLICAVSRDDGRSFIPNHPSRSVSRSLREMEGMLYFLEDDLSESYCYPAIADTGDGFVIGYYHSGGKKHCLTCNKITKVYYSELED